MLSSTILWGASILAGFVTAQNTSSTLPVPAFVDLNRKVLWCTAERNVCPLLCGGKQFTKENLCDGIKIPNYTCTCNNGTAPANIDAYVGSVPNSICVATFEQCRHENPGSQKCVTCSTLDAKNVPAGVVSSSVSSSDTATATGAADTAAAASPSASPGAAASVGRDSIVGGVAMGVMAVLGLLL